MISFLLIKIAIVWQFVI